MKFGGTSVGSAEALREVVRAVKVAAGRNDRPVVVVSALAGVTDLLVGLAQVVRDGDATATDLTLQNLERRHLDLARELDLLTLVGDALHAGVRDLRDWLLPLVGGPFPATARDRLLGIGELWSSRIVTAALARAQLPAEWFDARLVIRTNDRFGAAVPQMGDLRALVRDLLEPLVRDGAIVVTQGFIGSTADGHATTLGRGGSDFTAALLGAALHVDRVEIWTDVDGLMTADPRLVPDARILLRATYDESAELAAFGAKVLHPATQLPLVEAGIPLLVRNTFAQERPGTWIAAAANPEERGNVRSISFKRGVTVVQLRAPRMLGAYGYLRRIFEVFERHEIVIDVVSTSEVSVSLTVDDATRLPDALPDLRALGEVSLRRERGIIAVVGSALRDTPGVAARVYAALRDVNIEMISQGASASNLTLVIREVDGPNVVRALHRTFFGAAE